MVCFLSFGEMLLFQAIFGQLFLVFGLLIMFASRDKIGIIYSLVGFPVLVGALINMYGSPNIVQIFTEI